MIKKIAAWVLRDQLRTMESNFRQRVVDIETEVGQHAQETSHRNAQLCAQVDETGKVIVEMRAAHARDMARLRTANENARGRAALWRGLAKRRHSDVACELIRTMRAMRAQSDLVERLQAANESMGLPPGVDATPDELRAAIAAGLAPLIQRQADNDRIRELLAEGDHEGAALYAEAVLDAKYKAARL